MSNSTAQLLKKGKRGAAAYIQADCASGSPQHLGPLLDVLLNPSKTIDEWEIVDWCRWLMAGGRTPDEFAAVVRSYDKHDKCGLVWIPRVVAYRCRTCGISPCMSICRECFHRGDHSTHDFNMFLSQAGGACDCGDNSVMKEDGFCSNHGNKCPRPGTAPAELMCVAEAMMPRLILRLLQHFRENSWGAGTNSGSYRIAVQECEGYVQMLMEFNNMGDLMRSAMTKALINPQMYRDLVQPPFPDTEFGRYMAESHSMYEKALDSFPAPEPPDEYRNLPALAPIVVHGTLLDEFIFWTFKFEFPQNVVCFLLNMLPDQDYKEHLTRTFVLHYARIPLVLEAAAEPDTLSNRVVHMSVQLFSNEALALRCVQHLHLLHVMVLSLRLMMAKILVQNSLHDPANNKHQVIDCTRRVMKEHCYWPLVSDFNNVLSHKSVALLFLQDDALVEMWFEFLSMLQGMNVNVREVGSHIEFEPSSYYAAFSCELEAAAYPMWSVLSHLWAAEHAPLAARMVAAALAALRKWLHHTGLPHANHHPREGMHASFHFPLHRYLAAFLCAGVRCMGLRAADLLPPPDQLALLAVHPLRVQSLFYEILAGIWVRNGLQIKGQAMTYIQANFCNSMVDMDIYWLQICAGHLPADQFVNMCIDMFGVREWLSMSPMSPVQAAEQDSMVEGLLTFLAIIVSSRSNLGNDELTQSRLEVSTLLAAGDKTHSQLLELMPERSGNAHTRNFETVLKELSTYRPPPKGSENLEQGLFVPKPIVWEQYYEPLHVLRRAVHRRDFHASMDRFTAYVREKQKAAGSSSGGASGSGAGGGSLWPPLRAPPPPPPGAPDPRAICSSGVLHGCLLAVLHRAVHRRAPECSPRAPADHVVALAVFLLQTAANVHTPPHPLDVCVAEAPSSPPPPPPPRLLCCLRGDVCGNARHVVRAVRAHRPAAPPPPPAMYHADSDTEWEPSESDSARVSPSMVAPPNTSRELMLTQPLTMARTISADESESDSGDVTHFRALEQGGSRELVVREPPLLADVDMLALNEPVHLPAPMDAELEEPEWEVEGLAALPPAPSAPSDTSTHAYDALPDTQVQLHSESEDTVLVNESIISLLLKLHSQLSARLDSFSLEEPAPAEQGPIGDGPYFIARLLRSLCALDARCAAAVAHVRHALWPHQRERQAEQRAKERREKEERSRRARERQAAVLREFSRRQQDFLSSLAHQAADDAADEPSAHYTCVICSTCAPATTNEPLGLVALVQSTAVLGHRRRVGAEAEAGIETVDGAATLPLTEAQRGQLLAASAAHHHYRLHDDLANNFQEESWVVSVNVGWEGGVQAASCGHHLHLRCLAAYLRSLAAPQRPHNLQPERGEFLCPLCRQLANTALPLAPPPPRPPPPPAPATSAALAQHIQDMFDTHYPAPPHTRLSEAMGKAMEDMTATAGNKLRSRYGSSPACVLTFIASLVRTNVECELVQRGGALLPHPPPRYKPRNDCIVPLMVVAGAHARLLRSASGMSETWRELCVGAGAGAGAGAGGAAGAVVVRGEARAVPLLLRDPAALLLLALLLAPAHPPRMHIQHFTYIVRTLYTLNYYQVILQLIAGTTAEGRAALANSGRDSRVESTNPGVDSTGLGVESTGPGVEATGKHESGGLKAARVLLAALAGSELFTEDGLPSFSDGEVTNLHEMEGQLERLLLPFVRISALLKSHVYDLDLPHIESSADELPALARFLQLDDGSTPWNCANALTDSNEAAARHWATQLAHEARSAQLAIRRIALSLHVEWQPPRLLRLPREYDRLFSAYHERVCAACGAVPKEAAVCLLCAALVCLKAACCRRQHRAEAVQHAWECGGGTGVFLVVTSTYMVVIRGGRACLWGSLYLDHYDEEDRDLKRGKPLYLSQDRFELLEAQWLAHRFDHTKRTWVWHRDSL